MAVKMVFVLIIGFALISTVLNLMSQKHGKYLQGMLEHFDDGNDAAFQAAFEKMMAEDTDAIFLEKGKLLKLWYDIDKEHYDRIDEDLERINLDNIIGTDEEHVSIGDSEDALSYLYLFGPNTLYSRNHPELAEKLLKKREPYNAITQSSMMVRLADANVKFMTKEDDWGMGFYEELMSGIYNNLSFNSNLVNMYKDIAAINYCKYYYDKGWPKHFAEYAMYLHGIHNKKIGARWMKEVGLDLPDAFYNYQEGALNDYVIPGYIQAQFNEEPALKNEVNVFEDEIIDDDLIDDDIIDEQTEPETKEDTKE